MRKNILLLGIVLIVAVVALVSCDENIIKENEALGTWEHKIVGQGGELLFTLIVNPDLSCTMSVKYPGETDIAQGVWFAVTKTEGGFTLNWGEDPYAATFVVKGNQMVITPVDSSEEALTFIRVFK